MPTEKTVELFTYDELSPKAKSRAREWWARCNEGDSSQIEDLFDNDVENWGLPGVKVYFSLGYSQSDDVNFAGDIDLDALTSAHSAGNLGGEEADRYFASNAYQRVCSAYAALKATGVSDISAFYSVGRGYRSSTYASVNYVDAEGFFHEYGEGAIGQVLDELVASLQELARGPLRTQFMRMGYAQIEYENDEENIAETMAANEYTFLEDGTRFD